MTYNAFEQQLYNCDTIQEIVQLCVDNPQLSKEYLERQKRERLPPCGVLMHPRPTRCRTTGKDSDVMASNPMLLLNGVATCLLRK